MVRATDLLFGKIVVRNQLASEAIVRECLIALAADAGVATLGDVMVRRGLLSPIDAEKARNAAALAQAQRYLKFGQELGVLASEAGRHAIEELRRRQYRAGIGRVLLDMGMPREIHQAIVSRDPKTLEDSDAGDGAVSPAPAGAQQAPPLPPPAYPQPHAPPPPYPQAPAPSPPYPQPPPPPPAFPQQQQLAPPPPWGQPPAAPPPPPHPPPPGQPPLTLSEQRAEPDASRRAEPQITFEPSPRLPLAPPAGAPVALHGTARELVAVALRDGILSKPEVDAVLASGSPQLGKDSASLGDALVAAGLLARPQVDLIQAFITIERDDPDIQVEGFYLVAPLGFGAYGPVFQARRAGGPRPNETVDLALEVMPSSIARDPRKNDEFRRLCGYLPTAEHPALAKVVETGVSGSLTFLARESPPGISLAERIAKKVLPEADAVDLGRAVVDALGALALAQLAHGTIRPENIVLTQDGRWILRSVGATPAPVEWDPEEQPPCADLPRWVAPEVAAGHRPTPQSDMYSLGMVLYAAATGRAPYDGSTSAAILAQHAQGRLPDPATLGARLSARFGGMLQVLCSPDPARRYRDYVELLEELESIRGGGGAGDPESTILYQQGGAPPAAPDAVGGTEDNNDRTMVGSADEDADLKEMRRLAAERRMQKAAEAAGLMVGDASAQMAQPTPGQKGFDPLAGQVLSGRYRLVKKIGAGGMGTVYLAEHLLLHRFVAIKILHPKLLENQEAISRFDREVKASSRFQHPGVVQIFDAGEDQAANGNKLHYMVMEFVEGEDLHKIVAREGALPIARACRVFRQVLPAIDEAHKKGIVHRDMKTDNIMVCKGPDGHDVAKIMDFGIAKIIEGQDAGGTGLHEQQQFKTRKGVITGTPQYMSPEQASGDPNVDGRSDLYSFGVIMYEMILGELPFKSNTAMGYLGKHIVEPPIPVKEARPELDIGKDLERVIMKSLEKSKVDRYQTGGEVLRDLEETVFPQVLGTPVPPGAKKRGGGAGRLVRFFVYLLLLAGVGYGTFYGYGLWQQQRFEARAALLRAAGEAIGKGDAAAARAALDKVGDESAEDVKALRKAVEALDDDKKKSAAREALVAEAERAAQAGSLDLARQKLEDARKLGAAAETEPIVKLIEAKEKEARARALEAEGDKALAEDDAEAAKAAFEKAAGMSGGSDALPKKIARASARIAAREGLILRDAGDEPGAAEKLREALRLLPLDDEGAKDLEEKLGELLSRYDTKLRAQAPEERQRYFDALLARAAELDGRRDFTAAQRYYRDAVAFCAESRSADVSQVLREADARAEEQRQWHKAYDLSRETRAKATITPYDRTYASETLDQYIERYDGLDDATQKPRGHFVEEAKAERELLRKAIEERAKK